jgi:hypothetical protein
LIVFILTFASCLLFDVLKILSTVFKLLESYKALPSILADKSINDDLRQQKLLKASGFQLKNLLILVFKLLFAVLPFTILIFLDFDLNLLLQTEYILVSVAGILSYLIIKKFYAKTLGNK